MIQEALVRKQFRESIRIVTIALYANGCILSLLSPDDFSIEGSYDGATSTPLSQSTRGAVVFVRPRKVTRQPTENGPAPGSYEPQVLSPVLRFCLCPE